MTLACRDDLQVKEVLPLSIKNIRHVTEAHNKELVFILATAGYSGRAWRVERYLIHADGSFSNYTEVYNYMQYGHPEDYPL